MAETLYPKKPQNFSQVSGLFNVQLKQWKKASSQRDYITTCETLTLKIPDKNQHRAERLPKIVDSSHLRAIHY